MKRKPLIAFLVSLPVPGLGHIVTGKGNKGASILTAAIIIASLNVFFLLVFYEANPDPNNTWAYRIPRVSHDVIALWSIVYWIWAAVDAYREAKKE
jgi:hypothetical protein